MKKTKISIKGNKLYKYLGSANGFFGVDLQLGVITAAEVTTAVGKFICWKLLSKELED